MGDEEGHHRISSAQQWISSAQQETLSVEKETQSVQQVVLLIQEASTELEEAKELTRHIMGCMYNAAKISREATQKILNRIHFSNGLFTQAVDVQKKVIKITDNTIHLLRDAAYDLNKQATPPKQQSEKSGQETTASDEQSALLGLGGMALTPDVPSSLESTPVKKRK